MKNERPGARSPLDFVIVVVEIDVPRPQSVAPDEFLVSGRALILGVARQHALQGHAHALNILHWAPSLLTQQVQTDDAVRVDVGVYRYWSVGLLDEGHFRRLDWVLVPKPEHQPVDIWVEWVVVENLDIQVPRLEIVGRHERDARREVAGDFCQLLSEPPMRKVGTHGGMEEEEKAVGVGGVGMAPSRGRRPRLHTSGLGRYWR